MIPSWRHLRVFLASEDGPTAVEYAVMLLLVIMVCISIVSTIGGSVNHMFSSAASSMAH